MDIDQRPHRGEAEQPGRILCLKVDAAMAHRRAKIRMPVSTVQAVTFIKILNVRHVRQVPTHSAHIGITVFDVNVELTGDRGIAGNACRDHEGTHHLGALVRVGALVRQVHIDPVLVSGDVRGQLPSRRLADGGGFRGGFGPRFGREGRIGESG